MQLVFLPFFFLLSNFSVSVEPIEYSGDYFMEDVRDSFYIDTGQGQCFVALPKAIAKPNKNCGADKTYFDVHTDCEFKSFKLSIVDEANNLVFESNKPSAKWSGCNGYHAFPQGGYYYTIKYKVETSEGVERGKLEKGFTLNWYFFPKKF